MIKRFKKWYKRLKARQFMSSDSLGQRDDDFFYNDRDTVLADYQFTFQTEKGRRVFAHLKAVYGWGKPSFQPGMDRDTAAFFDGQKSVLKYIDEQIKFDESQKQDSPTGHRVTIPLN